MELRGVSTANMLMTRLLCYELGLLCVTRLTKEGRLTTGHVPSWEMCKMGKTNGESVFVDGGQQDSSEMGATMLRECGRMQMVERDDRMRTKVVSATRATEENIF